MMQVIFIVAPERFQKDEYGVPKKVLEDAGIRVLTASTTLTPSNTNNEQITADCTIENIPNADAIVVIGGSGAPMLFDNETLKNKIQAFAQLDKIVAAICISPVLLANMGLLEGKRATVYPSGADELKNWGAEYSDEPVVVDGRIITARDPNAAQEFGKALVRALQA